MRASRQRTGCRVSMSPSTRLMSPAGIAARTAMVPSRYSTMMIDAGDENGAWHIPCRVAHLVTASADQLKAQHAVDDGRDILQALPQSGLSVSQRQRVGHAVVPQVSERADDDGEKDNHSSRWRPGWESTCRRRSVTTFTQPPARSARHRCRSAAQCTARGRTSA